MFDTGIELITLVREIIRTKYNELKVILLEPFLWYLPSFVVIDFSLNVSMQNVVKSIKGALKKKLTKIKICWISLTPSDIKT